MFLFPGQLQGPSVLQHQNDGSAGLRHFLQKFQLSSRQGQPGSIQVFPAGFHRIPQADHGQIRAFHQALRRFRIFLSPVISQNHSGPPGVVSKLQANRILTPQLEGKFNRIRPPFFSPTVHYQLAIHIEPHTVLAGNPYASFEALRRLQRSRPNRAKAVGIQTGMRFRIDPVELNHGIHPGHHRLPFHFPAIIIAPRQPGSAFFAAKPPRMKRDDPLAEIAAPLFVTDLRFFSGQLSNPVQNCHHVSGIESGTIVPQSGLRCPRSHHCDLPAMPAERQKTAFIFQQTDLASGDFKGRFLMLSAVGHPLIASFVHIGILEQPQGELQLQYPSTGPIQNLFLHFPAPDQPQNPLCPLFMCEIIQLQIHPGFQSLANGVRLVRRRKMIIVQP